MASNPLFNTTVVNRLYGNVGRAYYYYVDPVLGDDTKGAVNQSPYATIAAAVTAANAGTTPCVVKLMPGTYAISANVTLNAGVSLIGSGSWATFVTISPTVGMQVFTLNPTCLVAQLSLTVTMSSGSGAVYGFYTSSDAVGNHALDAVNINMSSTTGVTGSTSFVAVGANFAASNQVVTVRNLKVTVSSASTAFSGNCYAVFTIPGAFTGCVVNVRNVVASTTSQNGLAFGAYLTNANVSVNLTDSALSCAFSDVYCPSGVATATVRDCAFSGGAFVNAFVRAYPFPVNHNFTAAGVVASGTTYAMPGGGASSTTEICEALPSKATFVGMGICTRAGPGGTATVVATLRRNGANTAMTLTLPSGNLTIFSSGSATAASAAVSCSAGDRIGVSLVTTAGSAAADLVVTLYAI